MGFSIIDLMNYVRKLYVEITKFMIGLNVFVELVFMGMVTVNSVKLAIVSYVMLMNVFCVLKDTIGTVILSSVKCVCKTANFAMNYKFVNNVSIITSLSLFLEFAYRRADNSTLM